jgi:hypothetical protein
MLIHEDIVTEVTQLLHTAGEQLTINNLDEVEHFAQEYFNHNLFRKMEGNGPQANEKALQTWEDCERLCFHTNSRIIGCNWVTHPLISRAARYCQDILGPLDNSFGFGTLSNNATFDHKFGTHKSLKLKHDVTITTNALLWSYSSTSPWFDKNLTVIKGNRMSFVPKTTETSRPIAVEPTFNVAYQQAVGQHVRYKLKKAGIDLNDQTRNKNAARVALRTGLATIDLKSASDTLAYETVRAVLPPDWFQLLTELRSPMTRMPNGKWRHLEKFSSMGNGFNFELETLIFFCICKACGVKEPLVYGDDIIVPQVQAPLVIKALLFMGFLVNEEKTFLSGSFFESCGGHYLYGLDVTPCYQKKFLNCEEEIIRFHNRLYRWALRDPYSQYDNNRFKLVATTLRYLRKLCVKTQIPDFCERDDGFLFPLSHFKVVIRDGVPSVKAIVIKPSKIRGRLSHDGAYLYKLLHPGELNAGMKGDPCYLVDKKLPTKPPVKEVVIGLV